MKKKKTEQERLAALRKSLELTQSGYAGIDRNGNKVDRREHPEAVPLQKSTPLGIPEPKKLPSEK